MNLFGVMEASGSAMQAERMRAEVVATNMANAETTRTASGVPYRRQHVVFAANEDFANLLGGAPTGLSLNSPSMNPTQPFTNTMQPAGGVHIAQVVADNASALKRYDPGHPDADSDGYVSYPDINPLTEMVDLMGATRAYGLNGSAVQAEKGMIASALEIAK